MLHGSIKKFYVALILFFTICCYLPFTLSLSMYLTGATGGDTDSSSFSGSVNHLDDGKRTLESIHKMPIFRAATFLTHRNHNTYMHDEKLLKSQTKTPMRRRRNATNPIKAKGMEMSGFLDRTNTTDYQLSATIKEEFKWLSNNIVLTSLPNQGSDFDDARKSLLYNYVICINNAYDVEDLLNIKLISLIDPTREFIQFAGYKEVEKMKVNEMNDQAKIEYLLRKTMWCDSMPLVYTNLILLNKTVSMSLYRAYEKLLRKRLSTKIGHLKKHVESVNSSNMIVSLKSGHEQKLKVQQTK